MVVLLLLCVVRFEGAPNLRVFGGIVRNYARTALIRTALCVSTDRLKNLRSHVAGLKGAPNLRGSGAPPGAPFRTASRRVERSFHSYMLAGCVYLNAPQLVDDCLGCSFSTALGIKVALCQVHSSALLG